MTEEIINSDGSRNWEANILLDNIKRLEQENKELKEERNQAVIHYNNLIAEIIADVPFMGIVDTRENVIDHLHKMQKALASLEEISGLASPHCTQCSQIINIIKEVLK